MICALAFACTALAAIAAEPQGVGSEQAPPAPRLFSAQLRIEVGADGVVTAVAPSPALSQVVNAALAENLRKVRFAPALLDGRPVAGVTYAWQEACLVPADGGSRLAVRFLGTGPGTANAIQRTPPQFPFEAQRAGASADVKATYRVEPDGSISVESTELASGRSRYTREFLAATRQWLAAQRAEPEQLDGRPVATRVSTHVVFKSGPSFSGPDARRQAQQHGEAERARMEAARIAGSRACGVAGGGSDAAQQPIALNSPFRHLAVE